MASSTSCVRKTHTTPIPLTAQALSSLGRIPRRDDDLEEGEIDEEAAPLLLTAQALSGLGRIPRYSDDLEDGEIIEGAFSRGHSREQLKLGRRPKVSARSAARAPATSGTDTPTVPRTPLEDSARVTKRNHLPNQGSSDRLYKRYLQRSQLAAVAPSRSTRTASQIVRGPLEDIAYENLLILFEVYENSEVITRAINLHRRPEDSMLAVGDLYMREDL